MKIKKILTLVILSGILVNYGCDTKEINNEDISTVKDIDGNVYHTVVIGTQTWMVENLKTTKFNSKEPITKITEWNDLEVGQYCNYNNDENIGNKYGRLYNYYAVHSGKLAPEGWHIPSKEEWQILKNYVNSNLGTSGSVAKALASTKDWSSSSKSGNVGFDLNSNNSSGFNAQPGGEFPGNYFSEISESCVLWSTSFDVYNSNNKDYYLPIIFKIEYSNSDVFIGQNEVGFFNSVRCIKD